MYRRQRGRGPGTRHLASYLLLVWSTWQLAVETQASAIFFARVAGACLERRKGWSLLFDETYHWPMCLCLAFLASLCLTQRQVSDCARAVCVVVIIAVAPRRGTKRVDKGGHANAGSKGAEQLINDGRGCADRPLQRSLLLYYYYYCCPRTECCSLAKFSRVSPSDLQTQHRLARTWSCSEYGEFDGT